MIPRTGGGNVHRRPRRPVKTLEKNFLSASNMKESPTPTKPTSTSKRRRTRVTAGPSFDPDQTSTPPSAAPRAKTVPSSKKASSKKKRKLEPDSPDRLIAWAERDTSRLAFREYYQATVQGAHYWLATPPSKKAPPPSPLSRREWEDGSRSNLGPSSIQQDGCPPLPFSLRVQACIPGTPLPQPGRSPLLYRGHGSGFNFLNRASVEKGPTLSMSHLDSLLTTQPASVVSRTLSGQTATDPCPGPDQHPSAAPSDDEPPQPNRSALDSVDTEMTEPGDLGGAAAEPSLMRHHPSFSDDLRKELKYASNGEQKRTQGMDGKASSSDAPSAADTRGFIASIGTIPDAAEGHSGPAPFVNRPQSVRTGSSGARTSRRPLSSPSAAGGQAGQPLPSTSLQQADPSATSWASSECVAGVSPQATPLQPKQLVMPSPSRSQCAPTPSLLTRPQQTDVATALSTARRLMPDLSPQALMPRLPENNTAGPQQSQDQCRLALPEPAAASKPLKVLEAPVARPFDPARQTSSSELNGQGYSAELPGRRQTAAAPAAVTVAAVSAPGLVAAAAYPSPSRSPSATLCRPPPPPSPRAKSSPGSGAATILCEETLSSPSSDNGSPSKVAAEPAASVVGSRYGIPRQGMLRPSGSLLLSPVAGMTSLSPHMKPPLQQQQCAHKVPSPQPTSAAAAAAPMNPFERRRRQAQAASIGLGGLCGASGRLAGGSGGGSWRRQGGVPWPAVGGDNSNSLYSPPASRPGMGSVSPYSGSRLGWIKSPKLAMMAAGGSPAASPRQAASPGAGDEVPVNETPVKDLLQGLPPSTFSFQRSLAALPLRRAKRQQALFRSPGGEFGRPPWQQAGKPSFLPPPAAPVIPIILSLDQALREAYLDARLASEWSCHKHAWARMDVHGMDICEETLVEYEIRLAEAKSKFQASRGQACADELLAVLEGEWRQLRILRMASLSRRGQVSGAVQVVNFEAQSAEGRDANTGMLLAAAGAGPAVPPAGDVLCEIRLVYRQKASSDKAQGRDVEAELPAVKSPERVNANLPPGSPLSHLKPAGSDLPAGADVPTRADLPSPAANESDGPSCTLAGGRLGQLIIAKGAVFNSVSILKNRRLSGCKRGRVTFAAQLELGQTLSYK